MKKDKVQIMAKYIKWTIRIGFLVLFLSFFLQPAVLSFLQRIFIPELPSVLHKAETYPLQVIIKGEVLGYNLDINQVRECESAVYEHLMFTKEPYWYMPDPDVIQINDDGSVIILKLISKYMCGNRMGRQNFVAKSFWFSSIADIEVIKQIPTHQLDALEVRFNRVSPETEIFKNRYNAAWLKYFYGNKDGRLGERKSYPDDPKTNHYLRPYAGFIKIVDGQTPQKIIDFVKNLPKDKPSHFTKKDVFGDSVDPRDRLNGGTASLEMNNNILSLDSVEETEKHEHLYLYKKNQPAFFEEKSYQIKEPFIYPRYKIFGYEFSFSEKTMDCRERKYIYFPEKNYIVAVAPCSTILIKPAIPILEEIKP